MAGTLASMRYGAFLAWMVLIAVSAAGLGCAGKRAAGSPRARYTFVYLVSGPNSGKGTQEERKAMFAGHMSNMGRLADEGKLLIAGPFSSPADKSWRGVFIFPADLVSEARDIVASDPGVKAGEFVAVIHPMTAPRWIERSLENDKAWLARQTVEASKPGEPPKTIRPYVLITAKDGATVERQIAGSALAKSLVLHGRFTDDGQGVFVLDCRDAAKARAACDALGMRDIIVDGWWSTGSLTTLRPEGETVEMDAAHAGG